MKKKKFAFSTLYSFLILSLFLTWAIPSLIAKFVQTPRRPEIDYWLNCAAKLKGSRFFPQPAVKYI